MTTESYFVGSTAYFKRFNYRRIVVDRLSHHALPQTFTIEVVLHLHSMFVVGFVERLVMKIVIGIKGSRLVKAGRSLEAWRRYVRWRKLHYKILTKLW